MSLKVDEVISELRDIGLPADKVKEAQTALEKLEAQKKEERADNKEPKKKNQFVIILNNSEKKIPAGTPLTGWVAQIPEGEDAQTTLDRVKRATVKQNTKIKKFIKHPLKTLGEALQYVRRAFTKEEDVHVKTKEEVTVLLTDNTL